MTNIKQNQTADELLKNYKSRLAKEGWIKSVLCGPSIGFGADILCAFAFWVFGIKLFWVYIITFILITALSTLLLYFYRFKSSNRQIASRIDMLGLEERVLTMTQLKDDNSYIARRQREDTMNKLKLINASSIKIAVSILMVIVCCTMLILSVGATTVSTIADKSLLELIHEKQEANEALENTFHLIYSVKDDIGGMILGELEQSVKDGTTGKTVQAVANDGYVFIGWSDGYDEATRTDDDVKKDLSVNAIFVEIESNDENDETLEEKGEGEPGNNSSNNTPQQPGDPSDSPGNGDGKGDGAGAGSDASSNQVIDGSTYYGDEYNSSLSDAQDSMNSDTNLSSDEKGIIGDYFHNIQK